MNTTHRPELTDSQRIEVERAREVIGAGGDLGIEGVRAIVGTVYPAPFPDDDYNRAIALGVAFSHARGLLEIVDQLTR